MATLALSVVGAGIGSYTGIGAGTGWQLGSALGQALDSDALNQGSSLTDLKISGASYGVNIPTLFGTMRLGGNIVWAAPLEAREAQKETGGKGGVSPTSSQSAYDYFASFAIGLARGEVGDVLKIWADGTLLYDVTAAGEVRVPNLQFRFYPGDAEQLPDSIMEADLGVGHVPAYRGLSYMVFDQLPLASYGNRIPNIEVLLTTDGVSYFPKIVGDSIDVEASSMAYDALRGHLYTYEDIGSTDKVRKFDLATLSLLNDAEIGTEIPVIPVPGSGFSMDREGDFWIGTGFGLLTGRQITKFNSKSMAIEIQKDLPSGVGAVSHSTDIQCLLTGASFQVAGSQQNGQIVVFDARLDVIDTLTVASQTCTGAITDSDETAWLAMSGLAAVSPVSDLQIIEVGITALQALSGTQFGTAQATHTIDASELTPLGGMSPETNTISRLVAHLKAWQALVFQNDYRLFKWSMIDHTITASVDFSGQSLLSLVSTNNGDEIAFIQSNRWVVYLSGETLEEIERIDLWSFSGVSNFNNWVYDAASDSVVVLGQSDPVQRLYLRRKNGGDADVKQTVQALTLSAGLAPEDVDASLVSSSFPGYILNRPMSIQDGLTPLLSAANLDLTESGYGLKFKPKIETVDLEVSYNDLLSPLSQNRIQESELPGTVTLSYMAADAGYQVGTQSAKRSYAPLSTMFGRNEVALGVPLAMDAGHAKAICQQQLYDAWAMRRGISSALPLKYLALDAADVIKVVTQTEEITGRLSQSWLGADFSLEFELNGLSSAWTEPNVTADSGTGYPDLRIERPAFTELFILDLPLLRDTDATGGMGSRYYFAMDGTGQNWRGAGLFSSQTGDRYEQRGVCQSALCWGVATTALGDTQNPWQTDRENSLTVRFLNGEERLESVSMLAILNGANALLVGDEIINFSSVTLNADGTYTLHTLLRGRRGTEAAVKNHEVAEKVLLLEEGRLCRDIMPLSHLNMSHYWKAVAAGQLVEEVPVQVKALTGRDLMPFAPVHVTAERTPESLVLRWVRRGRVGARSLSSNTPLSETSETYEILFEFDEKSLSKYVRNETVFSYELSEFNTDFDVLLSEIPTLTIQIFQVSETIGRGLPAKEIV